MKFHIKNYYKYSTVSQDLRLKNASVLSWRQILHTKRSRGKRDAGSGTRSEETNKPDRCMVEKSAVKTHSQCRTIGLDGNTYQCTSMTFDVVLYEHCWYTYCATQWLVIEFTLYMLVMWQCVWLLARTMQIYLQRMTENFSIFALTVDFRNGCISKRCLRNSTFVSYNDLISRLPYGERWK
jgi:hypothetical protein